MGNNMKVAAVQMECAPGRPAENLARAFTFAEKAAAQEAKLVLFPELMPSGYLTTEDLWQYAETLEGSSVRWLCDAARRLRIFLGFTFLEARGEDFFNTFVLAGPDGSFRGSVRKNPPCSVEAYFFRSAADSHVIETEIGRIGVGICYENLLYDQICFLHEQKVDIVLSPAAAPRPKPFMPGDVRRFETCLIEGRRTLAKTLGVPAIVANRAGPLNTPLPGPFPYLKSSFAGLSSIVAGDGLVQAELGDQEGMIVADVELGSGKTMPHAPKRYGKMWSTPVPWYAFIWPMSQKMGEKHYQQNPRRAAIARSKSAASGHAPSDFAKT